MLMTWEGSCLLDGAELLWKRHHTAYTSLRNSPLSHMHHDLGLPSNTSADTGTMAMDFLVSRTVRNEFLFLANYPHLPYSVIATETNQNREFQQTPPSSNRRHREPRMLFRDVPIISNKGEREGPTPDRLGPQSCDNPVYIAPRSGQV